jgi:plasmid maintenance system antidote protein VapI
MMRLGPLIEEVLNQHSISRKRASEALGVSESRLAALLKQTSVRIETIERLAQKLFAVTPEELLIEMCRMSLSGEYQYTGPPALAQWAETARKDWLAAARGSQKVRQGTNRWLSETPDHGMGDPEAKDLQDTYYFLGSYREDALQQSLDLVHELGLEGIVVAPIPSRPCKYYGRYAGEVGVGEEETFAVWLYFNGSLYKPVGFDESESMTDYALLAHRPYRDKRLFYVHGCHRLSNMGAALLLCDSALFHRKIVSALRSIPRFTPYFQSVVKVQVRLEQRGIEPDNISIEALRLYP